MSETKIRSLEALAAAARRHEARRQHGGPLPRMLRPDAHRPHPAPAGGARDGRPAGRDGDGGPPREQGSGAAGLRRGPAGRGAGRAGLRRSRGNRPRAHGGRGDPPDQSRTTTSRARPARNSARRSARLQQEIAAVRELGGEVRFTHEAVFSSTALLNAQLSGSAPGVTRTFGPGHGDLARAPASALSADRRARALRRASARDAGASSTASGHGTLADVVARPGGAARSPRPRHRRGDHRRVQLLRAARQVAQGGDHHDPAGAARAPRGRGAGLRQPRRPASAARSTRDRPRRRATSEEAVRPRPGSSRT